MLISKVVEFLIFLAKSRPGANSEELPGISRFPHPDGEPLRHTMHSATASSVTSVYLKVNFIFNVTTTIVHGSMSWL